MDYIMQLMHKGARIVKIRMYQYGYSECGVYEDNDNHIVEYHKDSAGVTIKSVKFTFSPKWRVIAIKKY
jgi:hypothetical protein